MYVNLKFQPTYSINLRKELIITLTFSLFYVYLRFFKLFVIFYSLQNFKILFQNIMYTLLNEIDKLTFNLLSELILLAFFY